MSSRLNPSDLIRAAAQLAEQKPTRGARFALFLRQVSPGFSPADYGATTLRKFLEEYPELVRIEHVEGTDILVSSVQPGDRGNLTTPIRRDLWSAFTLINGNVMRFYDVEHDSVITFPKEPQDGEPEEVRVRRDRVRREASRFVAITPVPTNEQLDQAKRWAEQQGPEDRDLLEQALKGPVWFRQFQTILRARRELSADWRSARTKFTLDAIHHWMSENKIRVPSLYEHSSRIRRSERIVAISRIRDDAHNEGISQREKILSALARMPTSLLLTIPIPAEYWFEAEA